MRKTNWPGNWKVCCDVCGMWYPSSEVKKRWDGLITCPKDWEPRHEQDFIRGVPDNPSVPFSRPEPTDTFRFVCDPISSLPWAEYGTAGCATVGYPAGWILAGFCPLDGVSVANMALADCAVPDTMF